MLRLNKPNHCVLVRPDQNTLGMLKKVEKYITWGEIDEKTLVNLFSKRGKTAGNKKIGLNNIRDKTGKPVDEFAGSLIQNTIKLNEIPGLKPVFRLKPPSKGFGTVGIKRPYSLGGVFGYRGEKINILLGKMI